MGDFGPHNVIVDRGRIRAVIDLDASGQGDRVIDLARLLRRADNNPTIRDRIFAEADAIDRHDRLLVAGAFWLVPSGSLIACTRRITGWETERNWTSPSMKPRAASTILSARARS